MVRPVVPSRTSGNGEEDGIAEAVPDVDAEVTPEMVVEAEGVVEAEAGRMLGM